MRKPARAAISDALPQFEDWSLGVERLIDAGQDRVVAFTYQSGTGRESGVPVEFKVGAVWELQEGRVVRLRSYLSHDDALEAAGLSENVETFIRGLDAYNRRDIDALLETLEPDVEFHPALAVLLGGKQTVFRGHQGMRESIQEEDEALAVFQVEVSEIRDLGTRILAIGHAHIRGKGSGLEIESPFCVLTESKGTRGKDTRATRIRTYVDPKEALEAAGLSE
jgi:ketosteroid isomerase-like protein